MLIQHSWLRDRAEPAALHATMVLLRLNIEYKCLQGCPHCGFVDAYRRGQADVNSCCLSAITIRNTYTGNQFSPPQREREGEISHCICHGEPITIRQKLPTNGHTEISYRFIIMLIYQLGREGAHFKRCCFARGRVCTQPSHFIRQLNNLLLQIIVSFQLQSNLITIAAISRGEKILMSFY